MNQEKKKLLITITLLLALILVMVISQVAKNTEEDDDVAEITDDSVVLEGEDQVDVDDELPPVVDDEVVEVADEDLDDEVSVIVNDGIIIEDITDEVRNEVPATYPYTNESLGLSYDYPSDWVNNESSVPGLYTVRVESELDKGVHARFDLRYYTATVDTDNVILTNIAGNIAYFNDDFVAREAVTIPLDAIAKQGIGEWTGKALEITYGVYTDVEVPDETLRNLFNLIMGDFNTILGSLEI